MPSNRDNDTAAVKTQSLKKQQPEDKLNNQNNQISQNSTNNKIDKQRRKLLFEYGLEKNFSNANTTNGSGHFAHNNTEPGVNAYNSKSNGLSNGPNLKN